MGMDRDRIYQKPKPRGVDPMELRGRLSVLRPWRMEDKEPLARHANNIKIWRNVTDHFPFPYELEDAEWFIDQCLNEDEPTRTFAITLDDEAVGCVGVEFQEDVYRKTARIGYWVGEAFWGRGIVTEALTLVTDYAFDTFDLVRLQAGVFAHNDASARVLEKAGYTFEGRLRANCFKDSKVIDELLYATIR